MNKHRMRGDWRRVKGRMRGKWGDLTDDDVDTIVGRRKPLAGPPQKRDSMVRKEIAEQIREFEDPDAMG